MPQKYEESIGNLFVSVEAISKRPQHALAVMTVIARWAEVENYILRMFADLLGREAELVTEIFIGVNSDTVRKSAMKLIANNKIPEHTVKLMKLVDRAYGLRKTRDLFAHGTWAVDSGIEDGIIVMRRRHELLSRAKQIASEAEAALKYEFFKKYDFSGCPDIRRD